MTRTDILALITGYDPLTLARWYVALSVYQWPDDAPIPKPEGFEDGLHKAALSHDFFDTLKDLVAPEDVSFVRWVQVDKKSAAAWAAWWDAREEQKEPAVWTW